ncbi:MAG: GntR family transcriptional regulator [Sediminimonas sp.]|uniref:GntR family transcriptional regulator n=1 Tax=Sediminimonas sp. TaxID=2823379 RepID=UPI0028707A03|nr:GntR family transcriptional regulator [Sediminimonas sp.]MDR9483899.1 GntR family transcriptional regulator [Sediminimonas sp.]
MEGTTRAERALIALRQRILNGDLSGGTRLFEVALAEELDISRTPIRAALSKLAEEGLLDRAKGGGFVVRSFRLPDVLDTIELRGVLEGTAARFAAERGVTKAALTQAREVVQQIDMALSGHEIDLDQYSKLNQQFHKLLVQMAQSDALAREIDRVTSLPFASPSAFLDDAASSDRLQRHLSAAHEQHRAIIDAIANREGARAESIAREHSRASRQNIIFLTRQEGSLRDGAPPLEILST